MTKASRFRWGSALESGITHIKGIDPTKVDYVDIHRTGGASEEYMVDIHLPSGKLSFRAKDIGAAEGIIKDLFKGETIPSSLYSLLGHPAATIETKTIGGSND